MSYTITSRLKSLLILILFLGPAVYGQQESSPLESRWKGHIDLREYMKPFWKTDTIHEEIIQMIEDKGIAEGALLFKAKRIISVRSADLGREFIEGKDWSYGNGKIKLLPNSAIPFIKRTDLLFNTEKPGWSMEGKTKGTFVLFNEGTYFRSMQVSVTYIPEKAPGWQGLVPVFAKHALPAFFSKIRKKKSIRLVFYGNSIETGANSSGFQNQPPYMPSWPELIVYKLRAAYPSEINFNNQSVGGKLARWGLENVNTAVAPKKPDLVVIGFGMNDGTAEVPPKDYRHNIEGIMEAVLKMNPKAEFILISPMLANPYATQNKIQSLYKAELDKLVRKGVVLADMTAVHQELLKYKSYQDMTGNNVNHPNDYLARWYAQLICGLLIK